MAPTRCTWTGNDPLVIDYHDVEWGVPVHDDRKLFEFMVLDAFQAGLSWKIILRKRNNFSNVFDHFDPGKIALYDEAKILELINDTGIIRNKVKIRSTVSNARLFLDIQKEFGNFDRYVWSFVHNKTIHNTWKQNSEIPSHTPESDRMSKDMIKRGFRFSGTTICYSFMQAAGMVNDHLITCYRYKELNAG
jgi:DNA-3-methyladenine glycosylase I